MISLEVVRVQHHYLWLGPKKQLSWPFGSAYYYRYSKGEGNKAILPNDHRIVVTSKDVILEFRQEFGDPLMGNGVRDSVSIRREEIPILTSWYFRQIDPLKLQKCDRSHWITEQWRRAAIPSYDEFHWLGSGLVLAPEYISLWLAYEDPPLRGRHKIVEYSQVITGNSQGGPSCMTFRGTAVRLPDGAEFGFMIEESLEAKTPRIHLGRFHPPRQRRGLPKTLTLLPGLALETGVRLLLP